jgi:hypothetical protein
MHAIYDCISYSKYNIPSLCLHGNADLARGALQDFLQALVGVVVLRRLHQGRIPWLMILYDRHDGEV